MQYVQFASDVNKDWMYKDKDLTHKDKDFTYNGP